MKHAVIYIPGLQQAWLPQSVDVICDLLAAGLVSSQQGRYRISTDVAQVRLANRDQVAMRTIERFSGNHWHPTIDIYEMGYADIYSNVQRNRGLLARFSFIIFANLCNAVALWRSIQFRGRQYPTADNRPRRGRRRLVLYFVVGGVYLFYAASLVCAVLGVVMKMLDSTYFPDWLTISSTIILVVGPKLLSENLTGKVTALFTDIESNWEYFWQWRWIERPFEGELIRYLPETMFALRAPMFMRLRTLMSYIREQSEAYRTVQILAYSQGAIIAVDTLFPVCGERLESETSLLAAPEVIEPIDRLLTLGFPSMWVTKTWKGYFDNRDLSRLRPKAWINFYFRDDALGDPVPSELIETTFRDRVRNRELPIDYQPVRLPAAVRWLSSIRQAHMAYFGISETTHNLFKEVAAKMFLEGEANTEN